MHHSRNAKHEGAIMTKGLIVLALSYALSQFYRAFLPVLSPILKQDLGATPQDLATASGVWFLVFAAMQIPVGSALDRFGPRWTASILFALGIGYFIFDEVPTVTMMIGAAIVISAGLMIILRERHLGLKRARQRKVTGTVGHH